MQCTGTVFMAKARPLATTSADGTFVLTLLVYDRLGSHITTPWKLTYTGPQAQAFWQAAQSKPLAPGQPLELHAQRIQAHSPGRFIAPEVHAIATHIALAPWAHEEKQHLAPVNAA